MSQFKVALLQMIACGNDQAANRAKGEDFCRRASAMGADIALFPEMWNVGYTPARPWDPSFELWRGPEQWPEGAAKDAESLQLSEVWQGQAIGRDDRFIAHFQAICERTWDGDCHHIPGTMGRLPAQFRIDHRPARGVIDDLCQAPHL